MSDTELRSNGAGVTSAKMRERVNRAKATQAARGFYNAHIPHRLLRELCSLEDAGERTLELAVRRMSLSARAHYGILKVSRSIADIGGSEHVSRKHVAEVVQYRASTGATGNKLLAADMFGLREDRRQSLARDRTGVDLGPGDYTLVVTATDGLAKTEAKATVPFRVQ